MHNDGESTQKAYFDPAQLTPDSEGYQVFQSTKLTEGAWGDFQHGAPPSALLTRMIEHFPENTEGMRTARIVVDLLGPVPFSPIKARAWVARPGKTITLIAAELLAESASGWRPVATATAWRMATGDSTAIAVSRDEPLPPVETCEVGDSEFTQWPGAYIASLEGGHLEDNVLTGASVSEEHRPKVHWVRSRHPIVAGETPTPIEQVMTVADAMNGVDPRVSFREWSFINTDLVVHFHREPLGGWVGMRGHKQFGPDGIGLTSGELHDVSGPFGRTEQGLLVRKL